MTSFDSGFPANRLLGISESEEKNLQIEVSEEDGYFVGRTLWFGCTSDQSMMCSFCDTENRDPSLMSRPLIGLEVDERIPIKGKNSWGNEKIYDPNSGHTYDAEIHLIGSNTVVVRGYWKFKWFGKSMRFNRLSSPGLIAQCPN